MRIAFNALSVTNLSGRHVLLGHLRQILNAASAGERHLLLHHADNRDLSEALQGQIDTHECPAFTERWPGRWLWENLFLSGLLRDEGVDVLFSPSGMITPGLKMPQIALAQNPWSFIPRARKGLISEIKAMMQRGYCRKSQRSADLMLFNSNYMKKMYEKNAGVAAAKSMILYQGIDDEIYNISRENAGFDERRSEILTVSVMARHKNIEDILDALYILQRTGLSAKLKLIGPWPDAKYKKFIIKKIASLDIADHVEILGYVSRKELYKIYSEARAFCLLSFSESFGIPAIEAQAFGTPTVVADCGAPPEIAGPGGIVVEAGNVAATADALRSLLTKQAAWSCYSVRARKNSERFRWSQCTRPLIEYLSSSDD